MKRPVETPQTEGPLRRAPEQKPSDFISTVKHSEKEIPVKQVIPAPAKRK